LGRLYAERAIALAILSTAALALAAPAPAADVAGFVPQYGGDQFMLYISRPIGSRRSSASTFGIRYERATLVSSNPTLQCCAPLRHHALIELQLSRGAAARVQFGNRVTWDLGRHQLVPTVMSNRAWQMPATALSSSMLAAWTP
jgi:hypothetical protein